jgi:long-chain acyl-CoA synthetase
MARQASAPCQMLYHRWLETSRRFAGQAAIHDGGGFITFGELAAAAANAPLATGPIIARSGSSDFFVEILRAWRDGQAVIPVEKDAPEPGFAVRRPQRRAW